MTFCSLKTETDQLIPPDVWTPLTFDLESADTPGWHSPGSALIFPNITAVAVVAAMVQWAAPLPAGDVGSFVSAQFARDPLTAAIDTTGTDKRAVTGGADYSATSWYFTIRPGQPLAVRVKTDAPAGRVVTLAEFKVWVP